MNEQLTLEQEIEMLEDFELFEKLSASNKEIIKKELIEKLKESEPAQQFNMLCEFENQEYVEILEKMRKIHLTEKQKI